MESLDLFIDSAKEFSDRELYPYFKEMDETPAHHKDGTVMVHKQVDVMMKKGGELGIISASFDYDAGGMQIPFHGTPSSRIYYGCCQQPPYQAM